VGPCSIDIWGPKLVILCPLDVNGIKNMSSAIGPLAYPTHLRYVFMQHTLLTYFNSA